MFEKKDPVSSLDNFRMESTLRGVDLNLLTVFDAVMQEQNITRAAHNLGMSQPAVSNAVSRLKTMFNDELFMRQGRGIQPTQRARQLFGPIRQALQLVRNELPGALFTPQTSNRQFNISIGSPHDLRFAPKIFSSISQQAPNVQLRLEGDFDQSLADRLRYQEIDFVIDYTRFEQSGFRSLELFRDDLVVVASKDHPRLAGQIDMNGVLHEKHATLSQTHGVKSFSEQAYRDIDCVSHYEGTSLSNVLYVVSQSELITIAPRWLVEGSPNRPLLQIIDVPFASKEICGYLSWHESSEKDKGHHWLKEQLVLVCQDVVSNQKFAR